MKYMPFIQHLRLLCDEYVGLHEFFGEIYRFFVTIHTVRAHVH
jgi:hypothetical protein